MGNKDAHRREKKKPKQTRPKRENVSQSAFRIIQEPTKDRT
jgi:hypothetical protein